MLSIPRTVSNRFPSVVIVQLFFATVGTEQVFGDSGLVPAKPPAPPGGSPPMSSALASQPVLRDIRDVLPLEPATNITPLIVAAIFLCLALIGWLLYRWRKSRRKSPPPIPCWTTALKRLEQLEKDRSSIDANQYAKTLTTILKEYLEQRYGLHIQARTTEEFLPEIPSHDIPELRTKQSQLRILLEQTDLIKFAQAGIDDDLRNDMVQRLRDFIRQTIPTKGVQQ